MMSRREFVKKTAKHAAAAKSSACRNSRRGVPVPHRVTEGDFHILAS